MTSISFDLYYDPEPDPLNEAEEQFLDSERCWVEAWDEARDRMPDQFRTDLIDWFQSTSRYQTVFEDWMQDD